MSKKGLVAEIIILAFLAISMAVLVVLYFILGPSGAGALSTVRFVFEDGYSNELSMISFLQSQYYSTINMGDILSSYYITSSDFLKSGLESRMDETFTKNKVTITIGEESITSDPGGSWDDYIIIKNKIPIFDGDVMSVNLWIFVG